jgi:hypothetical protein
MKLSLKTKTRSPIGPRCSQTCTYIRGAENIGQQKHGVENTEKNVWAGFEPMHDRLNSMLAHSSF